MARYNKATYRNYAYELGIWSKRRGWELYSFWVWYMDKNRSLSDGNLFDEYREKDFKCRKSEGFPKPLYYSQIPTPKATLKQQKGA